ncbi:MAG TPA: hypothetical protein VIK78_13410 [Ruminiclostridium sp.]
MFYDTKIEVYENLESYLSKTIYADVQPYTGTVRFNYGLSLEISNRVFCDVDNSINENSYLKIADQFYKVLGIKEWSDYMEVYLYRCMRVVA